MYVHKPNILCAKRKKKVLKAKNGPKLLGGPSANFLFTTVIFMGGFQKLTQCNPPNKVVLSLQQVRAQRKLRLRTEGHSCLGRLLGHTPSLSQKPGKPSVRQASICPTEEKATL